MASSSKKDNFMLRKVMITLAAVLVMLPQIQAQSINLGPEIGYQRAQDADEGKFMGGAALRLKLTPGFGAEVSINYRSESYLHGGLTVKSWPVMITALIYPIPIIYCAIGTGWYNTSFEFDHSGYPFASDETQQKIGWHFGGGLELPVGPSAKLIADIRYVFINYDFSGVPGLGETKSDFYVCSVGLLFGL